MGAIIYFSAFHAYLNESFLLHATKTNLTNSIYDSSRKKVMIQLGIANGQVLSRHSPIADYPSWYKDYNEVIQHQIQLIQPLVFEVFSYT